MRHRIACTLLGFGCALLGVLCIAAAVVVVMRGYARDNASADLYVASGHGDVPRMRKDIAIGANVNVDDPYTPLIAAALGGYPNAMMVLLDAGAEVNEMQGQADSGRTALHAAATSDCLECARLLVEHGAHLNLRDVAGKTPIDVAEEEHSRHVLAYLRSVIRSRRTRAGSAHGVGPVRAPEGAGTR